MNWDLNEKEARQVIAYRLRQDWNEKHKRFGNAMAWWLMIVGVLTSALVLIFRGEIKEWAPSQTIGFGLPVFIFCFWPGAVLYWQAIRCEIAAKKHAMLLYLPKRGV